jgi:hypothetical protein
MIVTGGHVKYEGKIKRVHCVTTASRRSVVISP